MFDAANALAAEVQRLTECLKNANSQAEYFERQWYLAVEDAERYRWLRRREVELRRYSAVGIRSSERLDDEIDAAIEEARAIGAV